MNREDAIRDDVRDLERLGYAQQLFREMGGFSNFAVSFSIISILTGAVLLYGYGLKFAGPIVNSVGWPLVSVFTLAVAASMAEIASAYPTAGGLYFWAFRLGGKTWAWTTAWLNMIGQVAITAGINIAAAIYLIGAVTRVFGIPSDALLHELVLPALRDGADPHSADRHQRLGHSPHRAAHRHQRLVAHRRRVSDRHPARVLRTSSQLAGVSLLRSSRLPNRSSRVLTVGEITIPSPLFRIVPGLAALYAAAPPLLLFVLALLQAQWTYTGYDASAHVAEETVMARRNSAWGIVLSVAVSAVVGYLMLMVLTWCIPHGDVAATANDPYPVLYIVSNNLTPFLANAIAIVIGVAMWLCGVASVTSMARMWYAFARDDGMPGSRWLKRVSGAQRTPVIAILVTCALSVAICLYASAWFVVTSISTICLYLAYGIPIYLNLRNRRRGTGEFMTSETAFWSLGRWSPADQRHRHRLDRHHHHRLHAPAERARALDHAGVSDRAHAALAFLGTPAFSGTADCVSVRERAGVADGT